MSDPKISLTQQAEAVRFALTRQNSLLSSRSIRELRPPREAEYDVKRLKAAARTLEWLGEHEAAIKAFLALPAEAREAVLRHGETLAAMCMELARREQAAAEGGPVR